MEIWDVVDKGKKRECLSNAMASTKDKLKMHNSTPTSANDDTGKNIPESAHLPPSLDAEFVDVYKGTNGVIFMFDMTKAWTFEYIEREIGRCPPHIPILILANHRDMGHHRVITSDQVQGFIDSILQKDIETGVTRTGQIRHSEASMRNGFGLRYLYKFFNLPYLHLQRETLLKQLERNLDEIGGTCQELDGMAESDENNYDIFLETITNRRRMVADQLSAVPKTGSETVPVPPRSVSVPANMSSVLNGTCNNTDENPPIVKPTPSIIIGANNPLPSRFQQKIQSKGSPSNQSNGNIANSNAKKIANNEERKQITPVKNIDDFIPDDGEHNMFRKFLDEPSLPPDCEQFPLSIVEEDSDDELSQSNNNPMVAKYQEELDPEDLIDVLDEVRCYEKAIVQSKVDNQIKETENANISEQKEIIKLQVTQVDSDNPTCEASNLENVDSNSNKNLEMIEANNVETISTETNQTILNCDDIDALENLYVHNSNVDYVKNDLNLLGLSSNVNIASEASSECSSITSGSACKSSKISRPTKKKKKAISKNVKVTNGMSECSVNGSDSVSKTKTTKGKLKTKNKNPPKVDKSEADIFDEERRQLEEFLGGGGGGGVDFDLNAKCDQGSYEML